MFKPDRNGVTKRPKAPDYYLIATNVRLSSVADTGGLDRVDGELSQLATELKMRGHAIWHYDQICRLLDAHADIRQTYGGFLTVGDVLASMQDFFTGPVVNIANQLRVHAAQQLRAKQWVRLGDSGLDDDAKLPLSEVGIDLPAQVVGTDDEEASRLEVRTVEHVLSHGDNSLRAKDRGQMPIGVVVVGGPGQGKSTIAQLVCQAYRASLIDESVAGLGANIAAILKGTRDSLVRMGVSPPRHRRWPVYVELSKFGDAIAADPQTSLLGYIAGEITTSGSQLLTNQLERWLQSWPCVIVLDGLDEVAALQTRQRVVDAISDFVIEAGAKDNDVLIVATTRPQGYHGEFGEFEPQQLELRPLTSKEGLSYGTQVVATRHRDDPELAKEVVERLTAASASEHTSRLMRSPLQVSIMATLLERFKRAPNTRHALFDAYYTTIYSREVSKAGRLGQLLDLYSDDVNYVHERIALHLQVRAELDGESDALVSDEALSRLFVQRLTDAGHPQGEIERLSRDLLMAAKDRIVLLVASQADRVGFEVRSLQEYMAARALASGNDEDVFGRLAVLASSAHWRNTWLLTAGRVFSKEEHLRDALLERVKQLDSTTFEGMFIGYGERLALDLLEDDLALPVPRYRKSLMAHALLALHRWPGPDTRRLGEMAHTMMISGDPESYELIRKALTEAFESTGRSKISAVMILRTWEKRAGKGGALAKLLLGRSSDWRPESNTVARKAQRHGSAADPIEPLFVYAALDSEQQAARRKVLTLLKKQKVVSDKSPAEAGAHAKQPISLTQALEFQASLGDPLVMRELMAAVDRVAIEDSVAAIWAQQMIVVIDERRVVGDEPLVSAGTEGFE